MGVVEDVLTRRGSKEEARVGVLLGWQLHVWVFLLVRKQAQASLLSKTIPSCESRNNCEKSQPTAYPDFPGNFGGHFVRITRAEFPLQHVATVEISHLKEMCNP